MEHIHEAALLSFVLQWCLDIPAKISTLLCQAVGRATAGYHLGTYKLTLKKVKGLEGLYRHKKLESDNRSVAYTGAHLCLCVC